MLLVDRLDELSEPLMIGNISATLSTRNGLWVLANKKITNMSKSMNNIVNTQPGEMPFNAAAPTVRGIKNERLNVGQMVTALMNQNAELAKGISATKRKTALVLGEIIGLTEHHQDANLISEKIDRVASIWMRQCNRLDNGKTDLKTIGKKLGIDGTPRDVMDRLSLFKFYHSQYKIMCRVSLTACEMRLLG